MSRYLGPYRLCVKVFEGHFGSSSNNCCSYHGICKKGTSSLRYIRSPHVWKAIHISSSSSHLVPASSVSVIKSQRLWKRQYVLTNSSAGLSIPHHLSTLSIRHSINIDSVPWSSLTREFHSSSFVRKEETKIEQTVKALKEQVAEQSKPAISSTPPPAEVGSPTAPPKTIGQRIMAEVKHYYHGFRLLFIDVRICCRLLFHLLRGTNLSRRERRQLVRTTADLFRLVPFLVFIVVPFMEFLLPVAVKLFPNMLPSTFKEENKEHEKVKRSLKVKLEMAKFLQDTIEESALQRQKKIKEGEKSMVLDFSNFLNKIRTSGTQASTAEIVKFSKLFEDEMTLDNLSRPQLQALCRVLEVPTIGTDTFLQFQLRMKLRQLKADDKMIEKEGVESLTIWELQSACRARGMRALGVPEDRLKSQLQQWLDLHLTEEIPTSLLLLSRALYLPETLSTADQLQATLSSLPETTAEKAKLKVAELTGDKVDNKAKLELIRQEEQAILKEKQDKAKEEAEATTQATAQAIIQAVREDAEAIAAKTAMDMKAELQDTAPIIDAEATEKLVDKVEELEKIGVQELIEIEAALEEIAEQKKLSIEQEELKELKEDVEEYKEDVEDLKEVILTGGGEVALGESKAAQRLIKRVDKMIGQLDDIIGELQEEREEIQEQIEVKEVKVKRSSGEKRDKILEEIQSKKDNIISINDMVLALKHYQKLPDDTRLQQIVEVLDDDKDGQINVDHVLKVLELLGKENIKLSTGQVSEVIELIKQETKIEHDEKVKKIKEEELSKQDAAKSDTQETMGKDKQQDVQ